MSHLRQLSKRQNNKCSLQKRKIQWCCFQKQTLKRNQKACTMRNVTTGRLRKPYLFCGDSLGIQCKFSTWKADLAPTLAPLLPHCALYLNPKLSHFITAFLSPETVYSSTNPIIYSGKPEIKAVPHTMKAVRLKSGFWLHACKPSVPKCWRGGEAAPWSVSWHLHPPQSPSQGWRNLWTDYSITSILVPCIMEESPRDNEDP